MRRIKKIMTINKVKKVGGVNVITKRFIKFLSVFSLFEIFISNTAYANSSWHWISHTRPLDVLPFAIIATLLIEIFMIVKFNKIKAIVKSSIVISIANMGSFLIPYLWDFIDFPKGSFIETMNSYPSYIIRSTYLFFTLIIEVPIVYFLLKKNCENRKKLLIVTIMANIITTGLVAIIERTICVGRW